MQGMCNVLISRDEKHEITSYYLLVCKHRMDSNTRS
jgi:hypothetical protein